MLNVVLASGLVVSGGIGFVLGADPSLLAGRGSSAHPEKVRRVVDTLYPLAVAFFAGFVLSTLAPHALMHSRHSLLAFACGALVMAILSKWIFKRDPCCETGHDHHGFGAVSVLAMAVCSLNDGILIGLLNPVWYAGLNLGMMVHKITSSFAIAQLLRQTKYRGLSLAGAGLAYTLVSPVALALVQFGPLAHFTETDTLLAFSAGLLTYVTLGSLVPHAYRIVRRRPRTIIGFAAAFAISVGLGFWHTSLHREFDAESVSEKSDPSTAGNAHP